jgi:hypothetical protein
LKIKILRNLEYIENSFKCYNASEKFHDNVIYYGDRFFYYPDVRNYKMRRNNRVNRVFRFDFYVERKVMQSFSISNEISLMIVKTKESLDELRKKYYCIETELSDSLMIREGLLKEKEIRLKSLVTQKEVDLVNLGYL